MTAQELSNLGVCGAGNALGTNTDNGCANIIKAAYSLWLLSPSLVIPATQEINAAYIKSLQKAGSLVVIKGINSFEENGNSDAYETLEDDTKILTNEGKYNFMATFTHGMYFQKALSSVSGFGRWRTAIVDNTGKILMTEGAAGVRGFRTGELVASKLVFPTNSAGLKQGLDWQLLDRFEMDDFSVIWNPENLDFDPRLVEPVTQVYLSFVNTPADADVVLTLKATFDRGRKDAFSGAGFAQFLHTINGVTSATTAGDDSATSGTYPVTIPAIATGEIGAIGLFDSSDNKNIVEVDGALYKSNTLSYTVG